MIADPAFPVHTERPPDDLVRLTVIARRGPMSLQTLHRWRLRKSDPLPTWRFGGVYFVSESEYAEWVARRSGRTGAPATSSPASAPPVLSAAQRRRAEHAMAECAALHP
jgi:hypothetical protein